jgi:hypothetical protein
MFINPLEGEGTGKAAAATEGGVVGAVLGGLLKN